MGLHERAEYLYQGGVLSLATPDTPDSAEVEEAFSSAMEWLHGNRLFSGAMLTEEPVRSLIDATSRYLYKGIDRGLEQSTPSELMVSKLKESAMVFSGFKTLHEMNEAAALLLDEKGYIKPFERFSKDVQTINDKYNKSYLRTEYEFAVSSSQMAAKWEEQQDDGGGRYLLQYRTMGDDKVRADHVKLDGVTLAPADPFWEEYYPPNGWGCRCTVVKVRAAKYPATDSEEAMTAGAEATKGKYSDMFRFNPGKQKTVFPAHNSYTISSCSTCTKSGLEPANELCAACSIIRGMAKVNVREIRRAVLEKFRGKSVYNAQLNGDVKFTKRGLQEFVNQPHKHYNEKNKLAYSIDDLVREGRYLGYTEYKATRMEPRSHILETTIAEDKSWLIVKENINEGFVLYSVSDNSTVLEDIKNGK